MLLKHSIQDLENTIEKPLKSEISTWILLQRHKFCFTQVIWRLREEILGVLNKSFVTTIILWKHNIYCQWILLKLSESIQVKKFKQMFYFYYL